MTAKRGDLLHNRYELFELIATGGMGEVWRAQDTRLNRDVAVKLLKPELAGQRGFLDRFRIEARNAALLTHPNVCAVFDYGETDVVAENPNTPPTAYLVMELVPGEPLSSIIAREAPLAPERVLDYLRQAASGLGAAHAAGVVHRDVKPGNLLVTPEGAVKITDFGVARASGQSNLTATGQVMGTAQYLAPEQALGETVTPAADNYALGVVGYQALTGVVPFVRESQVATALAQVNDPPPPLPDTVPEQVRELIMGLLRKEPESRPANGRDLAAAIMAIESGHHIALPVDTGTVMLTTQTAPTTMLRRGQAAAPAHRSTGATTVPGQPARRSGARLPLIFLLGLLLALGAWAGYRTLMKDDTAPTNPATVTRTSRSTVTVTTGSGTASRSGPSSSTTRTTKSPSSSASTPPHTTRTNPGAVTPTDQPPGQGYPVPDPTSSTSDVPTWHDTPQNPPPSWPSTTTGSTGSTGSTGTTGTGASTVGPPGTTSDATITAPDPATDSGTASGSGVIAEDTQ